MTPGFSPGPTETALDGDLAGARRWARLSERASDLVELTKPRIVALVLVVTTLAYLLAHKNALPLSTASLTLLAVGCAAGGAATLNNYRDRAIDAARARTRQRALPAGRVSPAAALGQGSVLLAAGIVVAAWGVGLLTSFLLLLASCLYVLIYTPLKGHRHSSRMVGAVAGAIPALCGWAAAGRGLGAGAWAVFALLFAWQYPHAEVVAWISDRQERAPSSIDSSRDDGSARRMFAFCLGTVAVSLLPALLGVSGAVYLIGAALLGVALAVVAVRFARLPTPVRARTLRVELVVYLPLILMVAVVDAHLPV